MNKSNWGQSSDRSAEMRQDTKICVRALVSLLFVFGTSSLDAAVGRTEGEARVTSSGAAEYVVPIALPKGIGSLQPQLSFRYVSAGGNSALGVGWQLAGFSAIRRCTGTWAQNGIPSAPSGSALDRFCLNGQQLRLKSGTYGADGSTYDTEIASFNHVIARGGTGQGPQWFEVWMKDGQVYEYGNTLDSRAEGAGGTTPHTWAVSKVRDRSGNWIAYSYVKDLATGSQKPFRVDYGLSAANPVASEHQVELVWSTGARSDELTTFEIGASAIETQRLSRIDIKSRSGGVLVTRRSYSLSYEYAPATQRSRLISIQECAQADCLPPTQFTWTNGALIWSPGQGTGTTWASGNEPTPIVVDLNRDGVDDLLWTSGTWRYQLAAPTQPSGFGSTIDTGITGSAYAFVVEWDGDGQTDILFGAAPGTWKVMRWTGSGFAAPIDTGIQAGTYWKQDHWFADVNGDGWEDLVRIDDSSYPYSIKWRLRNSTGNAFGSEAVAYSFTDAGPATNWLAWPYGAYLYSIGDFNGDRRIDVAVGAYLSEEVAVIRILRSTPSGFELVQDLSYFWAYLLRAPSVGDFNGDGVTDLLLFDSTPRLALSNKISFSTYPIQMTLGYDRVGDCNSDGLADVLVQVGTTGSEVLHCRVSTGRDLAPEASLGISSAGKTVRTGDFNGDGLVDILRVDGAANTFRLHYRQGAMPDLLDSATDGFGISATFAIQSAALGAHTPQGGATFPDVAYTGRLYVTTALTRSDGLGATYSESFQYFGGRTNQQGRGFLGFAQRRRTDSRNGLIDLETMRQDFPYVGLPATSVSLQPDGVRKINETSSSFSSLALGAGLETRHFPYASAETLKVYEVGGAFDNSLVRTIDTVRTVDSQSGVDIDVTVTTTEAATGNGIAPSRVHVSRSFLPVVFNDFNNWCIGRPAQKRQTRSHSGYGGTAVTQAIDFTWSGANCRVSQVVVEPGDAQLQVTTNYGYDGFGNVNRETVTGTGMAARETTYSWGANGVAPTMVTNALGHSTTRTWDYALGTVQTQTDPNGVVTTWTYDGLGRLTRETRPDGTYTTTGLSACSAPTYCGAADLRYVALETAYGPNSVAITNRYEYFDGLGRSRYREHTGFDGSLVREISVYDALGRETQASIPHTATPFWVTTSYDLLGRPTGVTRPVSQTDPTLQATTFFYEGLTVRALDPKGNQTSNVTSALGEAARVIDDSGLQQTTDFDPLGNAVRTIDSLGNTLETAVFNKRSMRTASMHTDLGAWAYSFNALGEQISNTDGNGKTSTTSYDVLGRLLTRTIPEGAGAITSTWTWGTSAAAREIGRLKQQRISGTGVTQYTEALTYDAAGRLAQKQYTEGASTNYLVNMEYSASTGLLEGLTYPASTSGYRLKLTHEYQNGHLARIRDFNAPSTVYWQANAANNFGHVVDEVFGNGVRTIRSVDAVNGRLAGVQSGLGGGSAIQNLSYLWDRNGNLIQRQDNNQGLTESFYYDDLDRLDYSMRNGVVNLDLTLDAHGNITGKSGVGTYTYGSSRLHAVTSINTGSATWTYAYDGNGNMTSRNGMEILWFANNLPKRVRRTPGSTADSSEFQYAPDGQRWRHAYRKGSTLFTHVHVGSLVEKVTQGTNVEWKHYIFANGRRVAVHERHSNGTNTTYYLQTDHLGSTDAITNATGGVFVRGSFDAFGKRRGTNWSGAPTATEINNFNTSTRRGFTSHEQLDSTELVHMGGRILDPIIGRFISADPLVDGQLTTQGRNHYSYVHNNPVSAVDPSGFAANETGPFICFDHNCNDAVGQVVRDYGSRGPPIGMSVYYANGITCVYGSCTIPVGGYFATIGLGANYDRVQINGFTVSDVPLMDVSLRFSTGSVLVGSYNLLNGRFTGSGLSIEKLIDPAHFAALDSYVLSRFGSFGAQLQASALRAAEFARATVEVAGVVVGAAEFGAAAVALRSAGGLGIGAASATPALPGALTLGRNADTGVDVYLGVRNGQAVYCGISCNLGQRAAQHGSRFTALDGLTTSSITRGEARAIEQALIVRNPGFENVRNSISPAHSWYQQAVDWGEAWLKANGL